MRKYCLILLFACFASIANAQVPYMAEPLGKGNNFTYFEFTSRLGANEQSAYTYWQHGATDWLDLGFDFEAGNDYHSLAFTLKPGYKFSKWFGVGAMIQPWFTSSDNFRFEGMLNTIIMQGSITSDESLFWVSNTYLGYLKEMKDYYYQYWTIGWDISLNNGDEIMPMVGVSHTLHFDEDPSPNVGIAYYHKDFGAYLFADDLAEKHPQLVVGLEFTF